MIKRKRREEDREGVDVQSTALIFSSNSSVALIIIQQILVLHGFGRGHLL